MARRYLPFALTLLTLSVGTTACKKKAPEALPATTPSPAETLSATTYSGEWRLQNLRRLTSGGENAEAYWSHDGQEIIFQSTRDTLQCDQIFRMNADGTNQRMVSTGEGRTTCSFLLPNGEGFVYSSSHATEKECPPPPDHSRGYVWPLNAHMEIYRVNSDGESTVLAPFEGYDAEAVVSPQGDRIIFTSTRSGDVDIWSMNLDGSDLRQLTDAIGYDGGAFFSRDGKHIVWRSHYPQGEALEDYKSLLAANLVRPSVMNLMIMDADGSNKRPILANGYANFAPYFHPDGKRIIFSSNMDSASGRDFDLYLINVDGTGLERVTFYDDFDSFPMFSLDGTKLIFASNRNGDVDGETNVFVADWNDTPPDFTEATTGSPDIDRIYKDIEVLASPAYEGRGIGTEGLARAASFLETRLQELGVQPGGADGSFRDAFDVSVRGVLQRATLTLNGKSIAREREFVPFSFSSSGSVEADTVYVGYGIHSADHEYNDYAGPHGDIDVKGKIVVLHRYEPQRFSDESRFSGAQPIPASDLRFKVMEAKHRGALGVIIVNPTPAGTEDDALMRFTSSPSDIGIPVVHVSAAGAARVLGDSFAALASTIDANGQPQSGASFGKASISIAIAREQATLANIVGILPATTKLSDEIVVIGAHYDHLGMGGDSSTRPGIEAIHPGADDNASGTATVLEIVRLAQNAARGRDIAIVFFTAEESGLLGSSHFVSQGPLKGRKIAAMMNLDMVGMLRDQMLHVSGTGTGKQMAEVARRAQSGLGLQLVVDKSGHGPSDHMSFYLAQIPVLALFTGTHSAYHNPDDVPSNLQKEGLGVVATYGLRALIDLANLETAPEYIASGAPRGGDRGGSGRRGYGPSFGSIPAFGETPGGGVRISGTRPGSPAEAAGLQADDIITRFAGVDVTSLEDFTFALRQQKSGAAIELTVRRGEQEIVLSATLGE